MNSFAIGILWFGIKHMIRKHVFIRRVLCIKRQFMNACVSIWVCEHVMISYHPSTIIRPSVQYQSGINPLSKYKYCTHCSACLLNYSLLFFFSFIFTTLPLISVCMLCDHAIQTSLLSTPFSYASVSVFLPPFSLILFLTLPPRHRDSAIN